MPIARATRSSKQRISKTFGPPAIEAFPEAASASAEASTAVNMSHILLRASASAATSRSCVRGVKSSRQVAASVLRKRPHRDGHSSCRPTQCLQHALNSQKPDICLARCAKASVHTDSTPSARHFVRSAPRVASRSVAAATRPAAACSAPKRRQLAPARSGDGQLAAYEEPETAREAIDTGA